MYKRQDIGAVNGFIEEMMEGQKVVKVFCHEEEAESDFKKLNDRLFESAYKANAYANIIGPVNAQLGNCLLYTSRPQCLMCLPHR